MSNHIEQIVDGLLVQVFNLLHPKAM